MDKQINQEASSPEENEKLNSNEDIHIDADSDEISSNDDPQDREAENCETIIPVPPEHDIKNMTKKAISNEKRQIAKNIVIVCVGWMLVFNAWNGLHRLQSSLHRVEGMGTVNISILHAAIMLSSLILPKPLIHLIGYKYTMIAGLAGYILWAAANGYAVWATMVPVSVIVGLMSAPMWTAQRTYFTLLGNRYAALDNEDKNSIIVYFLGFQIFIGNLGAITASVISSTVLRQPKHNISEDDLQFCGVNDCPWTNVTNPYTEKPPQSTVWLMLIIYIIIAFIGLAIIVIFVTPPPKWLIKKEDKLGKQTLKLFSGTIKQMRNKKQLALIPITMYKGFGMGIFAAEFTKSYVTCTLGIWQVGFISIPSSITSAVTSLLVGRLVKHTGRIPLFTVGFLIDIAIMATLLNWLPRPDQAYVHYMIAVVWGVSSAIWQTLPSAMYAVLFKDLIAAFGLSNLWGPLGWVIAFGYSPYLCTGVKLYIMLGLIAVAACGYYLTEYWVYTEQIHPQKTPKEN